MKISIGSLYSTLKWTYDGLTLPIVSPLRLLAEFEIDSENSMKK